MMQELFDDDDEELLFERLESMGVQLPRKVRRKSSIRLRIEAILKGSVRYPLRFILFIYGKLTWYLWGRRKFLKKIEGQKRRWMELGDVETPLIDQSIEQFPSMNWNPIASTVYNETVDKFRAVVPEPPVVTEKVAVDYHIIMGQPYLVGEDGKRVPDATIPKFTRKRPSRSTKRGGSKRGRAHR